ncbi:MAG: L-seryl-tRNA(Sec) selenium transferase, partial [Chloroflexota bacterium]|nr:L-seryl-tRNA(Sec) selenium transferase [Chloroflexota bacterium]
MAKKAATSDTQANGLRALPSVAALLADPAIRAATSLSPAGLTELLQGIVGEERAALLRGRPSTRAEIRERVLAEVTRFERPRLLPVINATGVIIHTNLGRAPVSAETAAAMASAAMGSVALEIDAETNQRGGRMREVSDLMRVLTGAEATLVVNNNAAAILLVLSAVAAGRSVILSRGEAVEIGGGFRIPDVLRQSGATLVEVGTTNRTYARDYAAAVDVGTAALLKVHPSNFKVMGFTHAATVEELAEIATTHGVPVIDDQGSGALL